MLHLFLLKGYAKSQINEATIFEFFLRINFILQYECIREERWSKKYLVCVPTEDGWKQEDDYYSASKTAPRLALVTSARY